MGVCVFFLPLLQSGSRTARPAGARSHACCRCGVGSLTEKKGRWRLAPVLRLFDPATPGSVDSLAEWRRSCGCVVNSPSLLPRLRRSSRCCSMTSSPWQLEPGTAGKLACLGSRMYEHLDWLVVVGLTLMWDNTVRITLFFKLDSAYVKKLNKDWPWVWWWNSGLFN